MSVEPEVQRETNPRLKWITKMIARVYLKVFHQFEVLGQEHLPAQPPVLAVTNHISNLDVPAFALADPYTGSCLVAKEELTKPPILGRVMHSWGAIPVSRDGRDSSALRLILQKLKEGRLVAIASEGTRHPTGGIGETNPTLARLAIQASNQGIPINPVAAVGTFECLPRGSWFPKPGKVKVLIGPQFTLAHLKGLPKDEAVRQAQVILRERLQVMMDSGLPIAPPVSAQTATPIAARAVTDTTG
jgi:1-acyl-sn-glycerol-3-phosphate acyltransferase